MGEAWIPSAVGPALCRSNPKCCYTVRGKACRMRDSSVSTAHDVSGKDESTTHSASRPGGPSAKREPSAEALGMGGG